MKLQFVERTSETKYTAQLQGDFPEETGRISCRSIPELKIMVLSLVAYEGHGWRLRDAIERVDALFNALAECESYNDVPFRVARGLDERDPNPVRFENPLAFNRAAATG